MEQPQLVGMLDGAGERLHEPRRGQDRQRLAGEELGEALPLDQLGGHEPAAFMPARREDADDVRVTQANHIEIDLGRRTRVGRPIRPGRDHRQGDEPAMRQVAGLVDHARPAVTRDSRGSCTRGPPGMATSRASRPRVPVRRIPTGSLPRPRRKAAGPARRRRRRWGSVASHHWTRSVGRASICQRWPCGQANTRFLKSVIAEVLSRTPRRRSSPVPA